MTAVESSLQRYLGEVELAAYTFYVWKSINDLALKERTILDVLNRNALSWQVMMHSLQCTFFISQGRIFDRNSKSFSVHKLLGTCKQKIHEFSKEQLRSRKGGHGPEPEWLDKYMANTYEATVQDFDPIEDDVAKWAEVFKRIYQPIRHKVFAHKDLKYIDASHSLFGQSKTCQVEDMLAFLYAIQRYIFELFYNGKKCRLTDFQHTGEERVSADVRSLLEALRPIQS
jgi:hypothetical protein